MYDVLTHSRSHPATEANEKEHLLEGRSTYTVSCPLNYWWQSTM